MTSGGDTEQDAAHHNATVDFVPGSCPTEPLVAAFDGVQAAKVKQIGRFQVTSVLGHGSFGTVYRAYDPLLDREVAVKVPRFAADDHAMLERFHREAKAAARLHHPNIVTLHESGQTNEGPYLVVEFVDGIPLSQMLHKQKHELPKVVDLVRQIAEGLHYAHSEGVVHRDIKPANIMMNRVGRPQVMDFGLAKRDADIESGMTVEGTIVGTPMYMSPEQARGTIAEVGARSDQYSVGVVLYEMLCGCVPFSGDSWRVIASVANVNLSPPTPRSIRPDLPRDLEACCLKALEKDPQLRYPNLQVFADDLDHWLKGLPLVARPIGPFERFSRWCRKNRLIAGLGGALATILIVAAIIGPWLAVRFQVLASAATHEAEEAKKAKELEKKSRLVTEQSIIDTYTETGLTADRNGNPLEAILWFANAAANSENFPQRERHNRIRVQSWLPKIAIPVQAFLQAAVWNKALAYHPSGELLLSLSLNGDCNLLRLSDGQCLAVPITGPIQAAVFSPDGSLLVLASEQVVSVFQFPMNQELDRWEHPDVVNSLQFSADGQALVVGGSKTVQVRDVPKKSFRTDLFEIGSRAMTTAIAPDGLCFAVRTEDHKIRVFCCAPDQPNSEPLLPVQLMASEGDLSPMFVANGRLVVVDHLHFARCWDIHTQEVVWKKPTNRVLTSAVSPDRKWIALAEDSEVVLLESATGQPSEQRLKHRNLVNNISFHPRGSLLLTACVDHTAHIFEVASGKSVGPAIPHNDAVHRCVWSPDGTTFATVHWRGDLIRVWKPADDQQEEFVAAPSAFGPFVRLNDKGDRWLPSGFDTWRERVEFEVLDVVTGQPVGPKLSGSGLISDAEFIPKSPNIVLVGGGTREDVTRALFDQNLDASGFVRFVNSETAQSLFADIVTPSQPIAVRASPDGQTIVVLCHRGHVLVLDAATGQPRAEHQAFGGAVATHGYVIRDRIRFSPQGDHFAIWGCSSLAEIRKTTNGERVCEFRHESSFLHDVQFSPNGQLVATCSSDQSVRLWNSTTGASGGPVLTHSGWVFNAQFSRDGRRLLTASSDQQARVWDVVTGTAMLATREQADQVFGVTFLPGEEVFLVAGRDGQLTAWDSSLGKMIAPPRRLPGMVYQLCRGDFGPQVIASGQIRPMRGFPWNRWILEPDWKLSREDVRLLGEILTSQHIHNGGAAMSLTTEQWFERWRKFRMKHPRSAVLNDAVLNDAVLNGAVLNDAVLNDAVLNDAVLKTQTQDSLPLNSQ